jgi:hypothetical protein
VSASHLAGLHLVHSVAQYRANSQQRRWESVSSVTVSILLDVGDPIGWNDLIAQFPAPHKTGAADPKGSGGS